MRNSMKKCGELRSWVILALVMAVCAVAVAEAGDENAEDKEVLTALEQQMLKRISVDFRDTPIEDVILIIAAQADVDIVKSPSVIGNVTAKLTDVPLEEALNNILAAHGYGYVSDKNMIRIAPLGEIAQRAEMLVDRVYRITYADVVEVEKALEKFISQRGSVSSLPGTSNIIVTDTESKIKAIDTFIDTLDRETPQILVEARIYDITSRDKLDLGIEWQAGYNTTYGSGGVTGSVGVDPTAGKDAPFITGNFSGTTAKTESMSGLLRVGWLSRGHDVDTILRAQEQNIDAKLLANPRILVLDNETALFDIVTEHPYVERTISSSTVTETVKFKDVGVKLEVTPHITRDGMVRMHLKPEFGVLVTRVTLGTSTVPVVDTRKVDTIALIKDGQTVVIGGLRKKDISKQINKIPLLGDLPLLGSLFRFEGEDTAVTELIVFITPRIIEHPGMSEAEEQAYEITEFSGPEVTPTKAEKAAVKEAEAVEEE